MTPTKLAITICATKSYCYALHTQARKVQAAVSEANIPPGIVILIGDGCEEFRKVVSLYSYLLPEWKVTSVSEPFEDGLKNYKKPAQLIIARMRSLAFETARRHGADACWSLDSDVLPALNSLSCMLHMLSFDKGYYSVSTCPYPSQGGGDFLGGRGTPENPILPDQYDDERTVSEELTKRIEAHKESLVKLNNKPNEEWFKEQQEIREEMKKCPPKGTVWELNAKNYRRRGWMSSAYPGIGKGAILPSDWCGFGCTLMNKQALNLAQFDGYDGGGTEDLYVVWKRWYRNDLKINVITHVPCDHVIRDTNNPGKYILVQTYHEDKGECVGHMRMEKRPWFQQIAGEIAES